MEEGVQVRSMPQSMEAERGVIGALLVNPAAAGDVGDIIRKDDFYHDTYGIIFETIGEMSDKGVAVDALTLGDELKKKNVSESIVSFEFLRDLQIDAGTSAHVKHYARIVKEKSILRKIIKVNEEIAADCYAGEKDLKEILNETEDKVFKLVRSGGAKEAVSIKEVLYKSLDKINANYKNKGALTGVPTGFADLDDCLAGLQPSDLILIGARPSMGKTAFVLNIAEHAAVKAGISVAIFSLEMSDIQLANRLLSLESTVSAEKLRKGDLDAGDWERIVDGTDVLSATGLIIDDTPGISVPELRSRCRKYKLEKNIGLVIIDYIQLMSGTGKTDSRVQEISEISRGLKALARELDVPVVALSQLSRAPDQRQDHRPMMSDLRESGAIEQDADVIMFIYRDEYYNKDTEERNVAEINVAKQRNGPLKTVKLAWLPDQTRFYNYSREYSEGTD